MGSLIRHPKEGRAFISADSRFCFISFGKIAWYDYEDCRMRSRGRLSILCGLWWSFVLDQESGTSEPFSSLTH